MKNLKLRLIVMNFLEFAVWGAYLTCMGNYLGTAGMGAEISWFYAIQGIVSIFMPTIMGIVADKYIQPQRLLGICHLIAGMAMIALAYMGMTNPTPDKVAFIAIYTLSVAFYMPTLALSNTVAFTILKDNGMDTEKDFPPIRVFGTIGFICTMWFVNCAVLDGGSFGFTLGENANKFQYTYMQFMVSGMLERRAVPVLPHLARVQAGEERVAVALRAVGLERLQALQDQEDGDVLHLLGIAGYVPAGDQRLCNALFDPLQE